MEISRPADMRDCKRRFGYPGIGMDIRYARKRAGNGGGIGVSESVCHRPGCRWCYTPMLWTGTMLITCISYVFSSSHRVVGLGEEMGEREKGGGRALDRFLRPELESRESLRPGFRGRPAPVGNCNPSSV